MFHPFFVGRRPATYQRRHIKDENIKDDIPTLSYDDDSSSSTAAAWPEVGGSEGGEGGGGALGVVVEALEDLVVKEAVVAAVVDPGRAVDADDVRGRVVGVGEPEF